MATRLLIFVVAVLYKTLRSRWPNPQLIFEAEKMHPSGAVAVPFFHENIISMTYSYRHTGRFRPLISSSKDGQLAADVASYFGYRPIRGSSRRGSEQAWLELKDALIARGENIGIPVDGPIGPRRVPKAGIIRLSQLGQIPLLPLLAEPESYWTVNSWDQFRIPKPFSRIIIRWGEPYIVPEHLSCEEFQEQLNLLQEKLNELERLAQADFERWDELSLSGSIDQ